MRRLCSQDVCCFLRTDLICCLLISRLDTFLHFCQCLKWPLVKTRCLIIRLVSRWNALFFFFFSLRRARTRQTLSCNLVKPNLMSIPCVCFFYYYFLLFFIFCGPIKLPPPQRLRRPTYQTDVAEQLPSPAHLTLPSSCGPAATAPTDCAKWNRNKWCSKVKQLHFSPHRLRLMRADKLYHVRMMRDRVEDVTCGFFCFFFFFCFSVSLPDFQKRWCVLAFERIHNL